MSDLQEMHGKVKRVKVEKLKPFNSEHMKIPSMENDNRNYFTLRK